MNSASLKVRAFRERDAEACARLIYEAVHTLATRDYSAEQRNAWAPEVMSTAVLLERLRDQVVFVAEDDAGVAGFMSLRLPQELDFAYVRPDCAGRGVALLLHEAIIEAARRAGSVELWTHASDLARRFFQKHGWKVERRRDFERNGVPIYNFEMTLRIQ